MVERAEKNSQLVIETLRSSHEKLIACLASDSKMRDVDYLWQIYSEVELGVALAKFTVERKKEHTGKFNEFRSSISNDPSKLPIEKLRSMLAGCQSDLEYALYDFETTGGTANGLDATRKCRDVLKSLILGHRKLEFRKEKKGTNNGEVKDS